MDHVIPVANGGTDHIENLRTSCWTCNIGKSSFDETATRRHGSRSTISDDTIREAFERVVNKEISVGQACEIYGFSYSVFGNRRRLLGLDYTPEFKSYMRRQAALKSMDSHMEKVKALLEQGVHIDEALAQVGINMGQFKWARRKVGEKWKRGARPWLAASRSGAIERVNSGESVASVARDLGVKRSTVHLWLKNHRSSQTQDTAS